MKLEHDPAHGVQTPSRKSYNPFDSDDDDTNGYVRTNVNYDIRSFEKNAESLTFHLDTADLSWEEAILAHAQISDHKIPGDTNGEEVLGRKDTELFTDKTVTECELPELVVCYKDNAYNSVKDIGIDEGVPTHEKVWIKSRDNQETKSLPTFLDDLGFENKDSVKEGRLDSEAFERQQCDNHCGTDDSKKVDEFKEELGKRESDSGRKITGDEMKIGDIFYDTRDSQLSERDELSKVEKKGNEASEEEHGIDNAVTLELPQESSEKPSIASSPEATMESNKNQSEEATSSQSPELQATQETADGSIASVLSYNSKVESGSIILDFNSPTTTVVEMEEGEKSEEIETVSAKPPVAQMMSRLDDGAHGSSSIATSSMDHRVHGDTSFSAAMTPPASINYMGPHAHTGSVSLRSESSAGSTRSFAFPVLQAEWNSSPVRMAKAEQRQMRKHRGWFNSLMCCRF